MSERSEFLTFMACLLFSRRGKCCAKFSFVRTIRCGMVGVTGIEPVTPSMSTKCSPAELYALTPKPLPLGQNSCPRSIKGFSAGFKSFCNSRSASYIGAVRKDDQMTPKEFHLYLPDTISTGVIFGSPHSGRDYPAEMLGASGLTIAQIRSSEDAFVDELYAVATKFGAPLIAASAPRAFVDLNRGASELDSEFIEGVSSIGNNPRVSSGLGVIPRVVADGRSVQSGKISAQEAETRLSRYYRPYHAQLKELMDTAHRAFGQVLLIDCHSMPHEALAHTAGVFGQTPDVILGDRFGSSCDSQIVEQVEKFLSEEGFRVARNAPFAGAFITQNYGRPSSGQYVLQIEIDRGLYMDETTITKSADFDGTRARLAGVIRQICDLGRWPMQLAAE